MNDNFWNMGGYGVYIWGSYAAALAIYPTLPSYRAMLDIEGAAGIADISLIGSEQEITDGLARIAAAGATDFTAVVMGGNPDELGRTRAVLRAFAATQPA